ncbi:ribonucleotide-diphosphate reductase subunit beta [Rubritalea marina]|uniref:ribonucleotide-diphosphate reductase subunit beta n=1 Tax=Rubritalea marina TaxID=361055 RepID=UPI00035CC22E|nr:ribonucleotide-diphosphate reductase subunit beta [Rubritalea marina]
MSERVAEAAKASQNHPATPSLERWGFEARSLPQTTSYPAQHHTMSTTTVTLGDRTFEIDEAKAQEAYAAKKVINGRDTMFFNILPLKYQWAYELYKEMKNNHWEPEDVALRADADLWDALPEEAQQVLQMLMGYQASSGEITGAEEIYAIRDIVTAPELKLVFGRYVHEQNTQQDVLVHIFSSLGLNPSQCTQGFAEVAAKLSAFTAEHLVELDRHLDMTDLANKRAFAKNTFFFSQCMEGLQLYSLYAQLIGLGHRGLLTGVSEIFTKLLRDAGFRCELFRKLFIELCQENPDIRDAAFDAELEALMQSAVAVEQEFIANALPELEQSGYTAESLTTYIDHVAAKRLASCGLGPEPAGSSLPQLDEVFFPSEVHAMHASATTSSSISDFDDDDL